MKPGDMIKWVYYCDNNVNVDGDEMLWSTPMNRWVPISVPALLISITKDEYVWLSEGGIFSAIMDDMNCTTSGFTTDLVIPWKRT